MKTQILRTSLSIILAFIACFTFTSCEKDTPGGGGTGGGGGNDPDPVNTCSVYGTFTAVQCGVGVYGQYWILLDNGKFLQPCETDVVTICPLPITEGTRVKFGYKPIFGRSSCDDMVTCAAIDERLINGSSKKVRITCIEIIGQDPKPGDCSITGTIMYHETCKLKYLQTDNGEQYEPMNQSVFNGFQVGDYVNFSFNPVHTFQATCSGGAAVEINCISPLSQPQTGVCVPLVIGEDPKVPPVEGGVHILNAYIEANCLKVKAGFSGCDGNTARLAMMWNGEVGGLVPSVDLKLVDSQPQMCNAYFMKEVSYDLSAIRQRQQGTVYIKLAGWDTPLAY